jgi:transglutaminase-like putative cysteine protease
MIFDIVHDTAYRYRRPVLPGEHRLRLRPRDSHVLRLLSATLDITPPARLRWSFDVFGNSVAHATFSEPTTTLSFSSRMQVAHYGAEPALLGLESTAEHFPFVYGADEAFDLAPSLTPRWPEEAERLRGWAAEIMAPLGETPATWDVLRTINDAIRAGLRYVVRHEEGVQSPAETLSRGSGSCRDYAVLLIETARALGLAARFISGYLHDPGGHLGAGATHAWLEIYLPGAGWVELDPTNGIVGNRDLVRIATARDAAQASPISGTFLGAPGDYEGLEVTVQVTAETIPAT